ncbi:MAG: recombinase family protein [Sphingomonas sp.]|nr:recombinase family protein [Sphingomonas sp.]
MTLNMLLSFAQFEREVTAERIRDKIAASKARGMWMGGTPPIGYRADGRSLAIVEDHAAIVRRIFERYRELGRVSAVVEELESDGVRSPQRLTTGGRSFGGRPFSRGQVYKLLSNATYIGRIDHGGRSHQGNHQAIVSDELFEAVQAILATNLNGHRRGHRASEESLLAGLLVDDRGVPMVASHACKGKVRYRYYVSRDLQRAPDARTASGWRLPAREIEPLVRVKLASALRDPIGLLAAIDVPLPDADGLKTLIDRGTVFATDVESRSAKGSRLVRRLIANVRLAPRNVILTLDAASVVGLFELDPPSASRNIEISIPARLRRSGMAMKLILEDSRPANRHVDGTLVQLIHRGRLWWKELLSDPKLTLEAIGRREGLTGGYVLRLVRLAFLDPAILSAILDGDAPTHLSADRLTGPDAMRLRWIDQQSQFGFSPLR